MPKKKIIIAGPLPPPYFGVSNATKITLEGLNKEFDILHLDTSDNRDSFNFGKYDLHNIYLGISSLVNCILLLSRNPEVIYIPISQSYPAYFRDAGFILLGKFFGKKIVLHLRGGYFREFYKNEKGLRKFLIKKTTAMADRIVVLGHSLKYIFEELTTPDKLGVVHNGVDTENFKPDHSKRYDKKFRICFISNFEQSKGWKEILECALLLKKELNSARYEILMAGKWRCREDEKYAAEFINKNGLNETVLIKGSVTGQDKVEMLQSSHLFLMPTSYRYEGQPWAIIEAMACGLPVISSPKGCIEETVLNKVNGYVVQHDDVTSIKNLITNYINNTDLANEMGSKSREMVLEKFSQKIFLFNLSKILADV